MKKSTAELFEIISKHKDLNSILKETGTELNTLPLHTYLEQLLDIRNLSKADVIAASNLNPNYAYQIFSGMKKSPSRDKILALCIGMSLEPDDAQQVLKIAGLAPLYPRNQRDLIIIFSLQQKKDILITNEILSDMGVALLE